jgi:hypothetical protein
MSGNRVGKLAQRRPDFLIDLGNIAFGVGGRANRPGSAPELRGRLGYRLFALRDDLKSAARR